MTTLNHEDAALNLPEQPVITLPRVRWTQILAISIFYFALTFHWIALGIIILPSQVLKIAGDAQKGEALAFVLIPGAFIALFSNPLFGMLSDRTRGRLAAWGRRRPYILAGTLFNIAALFWMAGARDITTLAIAYCIVQFSSNAAQAPFHALLPDIVPPQQRGLASGTMGLLQVLGTIGGIVIAGRLINSNAPWPQYQQGLWLSYGIIAAILLLLMIVTLFAVREGQGLSRRLLQQSQAANPENSEALSHNRKRRISRSTILNVAGTLFVVGCAWAIMWLWNQNHFAGIVLSSSVQQVVLEVFATLGILRMFDFNPRRDPDFAWVLATRLVMMLGIYTIQAFLLYYMSDAVKAPDPELATSNFTILVALTSLVSAFGVGWLSDRFGRKRMVYLSGGLMAVVGLVFIVTQSLPLVLASGALFGLGYGAYQSVDWALVADVLPSPHNFARDMGVWNVSLGITQILAPVIGGPLIDSFKAAGHTILGYQVIFGLAIFYCIAGTVTVRFIKGVKS